MTKKPPRADGTNEHQTYGKFLRYVRESRPSVTQEQVRDVGALYRHYGLPVSALLTSQAITDKLYEVIASALSWKGAPHVDLERLDRQLALRLMADKLDAREALLIIDILRDATRVAGQRAPPLDQKAPWRTAIVAARDYYLVSGRSMDVPASITPRTKAVGAAIASLRSLGFPVDIEGCTPKIGASWRPALSQDSRS